MDNELWGKRWNKFATTALHQGQSPDKWNSLSLVPPIQLASTFKLRDFKVAPEDYEYSRLGNPTRDCLEQCIAALENGKYGHAYSSGMAGITAAVQSLVKSGEHIITSDDVYGGTNRLFKNILSQLGIGCSFVDMEDLDAVKKAIATHKNTTLMWIETPSNPTMKVIDLREICKLSKDAGITSCVDNTFMSPYFQRPLDLGADIVFHSATKYINGHSDVIMGILVCNSEKLHKQLYLNQFSCGNMASPFDSYMALRGVQTLQIRMEKHFENAKKVCAFLKTHPRVEKVNYPGDDSHPRHHVLRKNATGCSGMMGFYLRDGSVEKARIFHKAIRVVTFAQSLGGCESLAEHPGELTHRDMDPEERERLGINDSYIRLSVGIEDPEELINDLGQALDAAYAE